MLFQKSNYRKNLERLYFYLSEITNDANSRFSTPDCLPYIKPNFDKVVENSKSQIEQWTAATDVRTIVYKNVYHIVFNVLASGELHLYRGVLDPLKPGDKLLYIIDDCLDYYIKNGFVTKEEAKDQKDYLWEEIGSVG